MPGREILGGYFWYCQYCAHDGSCALLHHEYMGVPRGGDEILRRGYGHSENFIGLFTLFQRGRIVSQCPGRIVAKDSVFFPLACRCSTVVNDGFCQKFTSTEAGRERFEAAERIAAERGIELSKVPRHDLPHPPDPAYQSEVTDWEEVPEGN